MTGPAGKRLTINDLPPANIKRWTILRKAAVVLAVRRSLIAREDACARYRISAEELLSWELSIDKHGTRGLRAKARPGKPPPAPPRCWAKITAPLKRWPGC